MELLYLWVEKYNNIEKQGFNFSSKYKFDFDYDKKELKYEENTNSITDGFFGDNITNITAIIGKNGSGKSSVLELLVNTLRVRNQGQNIADNIIVIFNKKNEKRVYIGEKIIIKNKRRFLKEYSIKNEKILNEVGAGENYSTVFFSNSIEDNNIDTVGGIYDLSLRKLLDDNNYNMTLVNNKLNEMKLRFIVDNLYNKYTIMKTIPSEVVLSLKNIEDIDLENYFLQFCGEKKEEIRQKNDKDIYYFICLNYFTDCNLYFSKSLKNLGIETENIIGIFDNKLRKKEIKTIIEKGKEYLKKIKYEYIRSISEINNEYNSNLIYREVRFNGKYYDRVELENKSIVSLINLSQNLLEFIEKFDISKIGEKNNILEIKEIMYLYFNTFKRIGYLDIKFLPKISSGEEMLLIIFSKIYSIKQSQNFDKRDILIFMDEVELYLHPEWQRGFLNILIKFIKNAFNDQKIQIILTSHSPFVVSDLPRENVIFLDKDDKGMCKVVDSSEKKKTFGANIHTLLSDGFFMESTLGEFARSKISWGMEILDKDIETIRKEEKKIREILEMIGEPIIKTKLMKMLEDKLKLNLIGVDDRIRKLEIEIEELKRLKGE